MRIAFSLLFLSVLFLCAPEAEAAAPRQTTVRLEGLDLKMSARNLNRLKHAVRRVPGVRRANVDLATGQLYVTHRRAMKKKQLIRAAARVGFRAIPPSLHADNTTVAKKKS